VDVKEIMINKITLIADTAVWKVTLINAIVPEMNLRVG